MKHTKKITFVLLAMFLIAQIIGLYVASSYTTQAIVNGKTVNVSGKTIPYGAGFDQTQNMKTEPISFLISFLLSLAIVIFLILFLIKTKSKIIMRLWFFGVVTLALGITLTAFLPEFQNASLVALGIGAILAFLKIFKRDIMIHNLTELFIYPGIAAIFSPILSIIAVIVLLVVISIYDMWAVWKSKIMQKMAKFQMEKLNLFGGLMIPYANKKTKKKLKVLKQKYKTKKSLERAFKKSKLKIQLAVLGGGDIVYPIITSSVVLRTWGFIPAIVTVAGALLGLAGLMIFGKKKAYPAMPYITAGLLLGMLVSYLFLI